MFYLQLQVIQDRKLQAETRRGAASTSVRVSEDLSQPLPSPVPKLPGHSLSLPTDTASTVGRLYNYNPQQRYYLYYLCHLSPDVDIHMNGDTESEDKSHPRPHPVPKQDILCTPRDDTACQRVMASSQDDIIDPKPGLYLYV